MICIDSCPKICLCCCILTICTSCTRTNNLLFVTVKYLNNKNYTALKLVLTNASLWVNSCGDQRIVSNVQMTNKSFAITYKCQTKLLNRKSYLQRWSREVHRVSEWRKFSIASHFAYNYHCVLGVEITRVVV